ncbi:MAG: hypothetical protein KDH20_17075 [Rhodocyclaceae bacterium]|nr:hypothetical protein [Rhodocyclaceae bacterium]
MHCVDGEDYSVFSILPPYNNLHAQLVRNGELVTGGVTLTFESLADSQGSINTTSVGKTNFWSYAAALYGADLAPDEGLTGLRTASRTPQALTWNAEHRWYEAEGIPITPIDDAGQRNTYPLVKVVARDGAGNAVATASVVLPVSSEMNCVACHGSDSVRDDARPTAGWVGDSDPEKDWKRNILRLHDEKQAGNADFAAALAERGHLPAGLEATAASGKPILCAGCHASNALPGTGIDGIAPLTRVLHASHATVSDPANGRQLGAAGDRDACYLCHPGSSTQCLRGAMGDAVDAQGNAAMGCQDCHGGMAQVGSASRQGWLDMPNCQSCHQDGQRLTRAVDAAGVPLAASDTRFATQPDTPASGISLYRFSTGHGGLQCEACHGATHAIYPSSHASDNLLSIGVQGHAGTVAECAACHQDGVPLTTTGGPHGMHTTGATWVSRHEDAAERNPGQCRACHGDDYRGSPLGAVATTRSYRAEGKTVRYAAGDEVTCYDCHNGPDGD